MTVNESALVGNVLTGLAFATDPRLCQIVSGSWKRRMGTDALPTPKLHKFLANGEASKSTILYNRVQTALIGEGQSL